MNFPLTEITNCLRVTILMSLANRPEYNDWGFIQRLCRTLDYEIGGNRLYRLTKRRDNIAVYQLVDMLGLDNEEKLLIFGPIFQNEIRCESPRGSETEEVYAIEKD